MTEKTTTMKIGKNISGIGIAIFAAPLIPMTAWIILTGEMPAPVAWIGTGTAFLGLGTAFCGFAISYLKKEE